MSLYCSRSSSRLVRACSRSRTHASRRPHTKRPVAPPPPPRRPPPRPPLTVQGHRLLPDFAHAGPLGPHHRQRLHRPVPHRGSVVYRSLCFSAPFLSLLSLMLQLT